MYGGVSGNADQAVKDFLDGNLKYTPDVTCRHHDEHHGEGHSCNGQDDVDLYLKLTQDLRGKLTHPRGAMSK